MRKILKWRTISISGLIGVIVIVMVIATVSGCVGNGGDVDQTRISAPASVPSPTSAPTATAIPTPTAVLATAIIPTAALPETCVEPDGPDLTSLLTELQSCKPDLSMDAKETISLFIELQQFKDDPEFHQVGFGACCHFNSWKEEIDALQGTADVGTISEIGIVPADIFAIAQEGSVCYRGMGVVDCPR